MQPDSDLNSSIQANGIERPPAPPRGHNYIPINSCTFDIGSLTLHNPLRHNPASLLYDGDIGVGSDVI